MLKIREAIAVKIQTAHGTAATPSPTSEAVLCSNLSFSYVDSRMLDRNIVKNTKGKLAQVYGGSLGQVTFDVELKGSGTAGAGPEIAACLVACGMAETIVASTSATYTPATANQQYATIYFYQDGVLRSLEDAVGTFSLNLEAGSFGTASFTFTGHLGTPSDTAFPSTAYDASVPVPVIGGAFTIGGYSASITKLAIDRGNNIVKPASYSASDGYGQIRILDWDCTGSFDPSAELLATKDYVDQWASGTALALASGTIGSTAGNRYAITMPAVSYRSVAYGEREAIRTYEVGFGAAEVSGDDELSIAFT